MLHLDADAGDMQFPANGDGLHGTATVEGCVCLPDSCMAGAAIERGRELVASDVASQWLFLPPWVHPASGHGTVGGLVDTQTNAGALACLQPADYIIATYPSSTPSPPCAAAAGSSPATRSSSRGSGRRSPAGKAASTTPAAPAHLYGPSTLVHFRRTASFKQIADASVWAALLRPADVPDARLALVTLMKLERELLLFYKNHCNRYMAGVCVRLQQATALAEAGKGDGVLDALQAEVKQLQMGLFINIPDDPTQLPAFLVPYSKATPGEAAAGAGSDSDEVEVVEVGDAPPPSKARASAAAVLLD